MNGLTCLVVAVMAAMVLFYHRASLGVWITATLTGLILCSAYAAVAIGFKIVWWLVGGAILTVLAVPRLRQQWLSQRVLDFFVRVMPPMSVTEQEALDAGGVGFEAELFGGRPDWQAFLNLPAPALTQAEQAFLDGPVVDLVAEVDEWAISHEHFDLPASIWTFLKKERFFSMAIPKEFGGLGFSAYAISQVLIKLGAISPVLGSTVCVPNSLGPAELLIRYGTQAQKDRYLPGLASGDEIPCFALTAPEAGSDASAMPDYGVITHGEHDGQMVLGIRLSFNKRYITLAPVATIIALAFRLFDPEKHLGEETELGITCALLPSNHPGIEIGRRHLPMGTPLLNGPIRGDNIFIPLDWVIGGQARVGQGWRMLMECLAEGRAISLPSIATGNAKLASYTCGAYARIRKQFGVSIAMFEGIQESLQVIAGNTYIMSAMGSFTAGAIDRGEKSAIAAAMAKYHVTELGREAVIHAMDLHGGKGICQGPNNYLASLYTGLPIMITVEGANILTRSLIIFGQGAVRCHPYLLREIEAVKQPESAQRLIDFDRAFIAHLGFIASMKVRAFVLGLSFGRLVIPPANAHKQTRRYFQQLTRYCSAFAFLADCCLLLLGGALKRKESLSGRLGDCLSYLYMIAVVLKRFHDEGQHESDLAIIHCLCQDLFYRLSLALDNTLKNLPNRWLRLPLRLIIFPLGRQQPAPSDEQRRRLATLMIKPSAARDRLVAGCYLPIEGDHPMAIMEQALLQTIACEALDKRVQKAAKSGAIEGVTLAEQVDAAIAVELITAEEGEQLLQAHALRLQIINVDDFDPEALVAQQTRHSADVA